MVHRPKSVVGYLVLFLITLGITYVVTLLDPLASPWVWGPLAVIVLTSFVVFARQRQLEATRERAWVGAFSFGDVVACRREEEALRRAEDAR